MTNNTPLEPDALVPREYAGNWIAWNNSQTAIVAVSDTLADVREATRKAGIADPEIAKAPRADVRFVGAGA